MWYRTNRDTVLRNREYFVFFSQLILGYKQTFNSITQINGKHIKHTGLPIVIGSALWSYNCKSRIKLGEPTFAEFQVTTIDSLISPSLRISYPDMVQKDPFLLLIFPVLIVDFWNLGFSQLSYKIPGYKQTFTVIASLCTSIHNQEWPTCMPEGFNCKNSFVPQN